MDGVFRQLLRLAHGAEPFPTEQATVFSVVYGTVTGAVHDTTCPHCERVSCVCVWCPGGKAMLMHCIYCGHEFEIDGE